MKNSSLLAHPPGPGLLRRCDACRRLRGLVAVDKGQKRHEVTVTTYRCRFCDAQVAFADRHPPGAV